MWRNSTKFYSIQTHSGQTRSSLFSPQNPVKVHYLILLNNYSNNSYQTLKELSKCQVRHQGCSLEHEFHVYIPPEQIGTRDQEYSSSTVLVTHYINSYKT